MVQTHTEQLVSTESEDGYLLEGALFTPSQGEGGKLPVVWMHGFTGRFYEQHTVAIGRRLAARGHAFVTGNNRGHHLGATIVNLRGGEGLRGGGWWELFDACLFDYSAWIGFAVSLVVLHAGFAEMGAVAGMVVGHAQDLSGEIGRGGAGRSGAPAVLR